MFYFSLNPFPHIDAFGRLCSRWLFENIVTKEEIAQNVQFLLLPQCFPLFVIVYPFKLWRFSMFWQNMFKVIWCRIVVWGKGLRGITGLMREKKKSSVINDGSISYIILTCQMFSRFITFTLSYTICVFYSSLKRNYCF